MVTPARAIELIESQFPALAPAALEPLGVGWDNTAFVVNGSHVFRFPRREVASPLLAAEASLLPLVARHLPLPIPVPSLRGQPSARYRWPFLGYPMLPGRTACQFRLDEAQRIAPGPAAGAVPGGAARLPGGPGRRQRRDRATPSAAWT